MADSGELSTSLKRNLHCHFSLPRKDKEVGIENLKPLQVSDKFSVWVHRVEFFAGLGDKLRSHNVAWQYGWAFVGGEQAEFDCGEAQAAGSFTGDTITGFEL